MRATHRMERSRYQEQNEGKSSRLRLGKPMRMSDASTCQRHAQSSYEITVSVQHAQGGMVRAVAVKRTCCGCAGGGET
jgi:hypothetical protein